MHTYTPTDTRTHALSLSLSLFFSLSVSLTHAHTHTHTHTRIYICKLGCVSVRLERALCWSGQLYGSGRCVGSCANTCLVVHLFGWSTILEGAPCGTAQIFAQQTVESQLVEPAASCLRTPFCARSFLSPHTLFPMTSPGGCASNLSSLVRWDEGCEGAKRWAVRVMGLP